MLKSPYAAIWILLAFVGPLGAWFVRGFLDSNNTPAPTPPEPAAYIDVPAEVTAPLGRQFVIHNKGTAPVTHWKLLDRPSEAGPEPIDLTEMNAGQDVIFTAPKIGTYWLRAEAPKGTDIVEGRTRVTVPSPEPTPTPIPPTPPPAPAPTDPFLAALEAAWQADQDPTKQANRLLLEGMYATYEISIPDSVKTYGDLFAVMAAAAKNKLPADALTRERKVIADYLVSQFGTDPTKPVDKTLTAKVFGAVADALGGLK